MMKEKVKITEVGPRDGLQNEKTLVPLEVKFQFIENLVHAGMVNIEAGSFVSAKAVPQMKDSSELFLKIHSSSFFQGHSFPVLAPNLKGLEKALEVGVKEISFFTATSDSFTKKNINSTIAESFVNIQEMAAVCQAKGIKMRGYLSTVFGCPYEGKMPLEKAIELAQKLLALGCAEVSLGDTIGVGTPPEVKKILSLCKNSIGLDKVAMHFHDTCGMALANVLVSLDLGIRSFDSSAGGIGGCPYAPGATGNVGTEDILYLLHSLGFETGIEERKVFFASGQLLKVLGKTSPSKRHLYLLSQEKKP